MIQTGKQQYEVQIVLRGAWHAEDIERLENIKELATLALKYDNLENGLGIERLLEDAALASDQDSLITNTDKKEIKNGVKLMTVHASKGLEFKYVFVGSMVDARFPSRGRADAIPLPDGLIQERPSDAAAVRARGSRGVLGC